MTKNVEPTYFDFLFFQRISSVFNLRTTKNLVSGIDQRVSK